MEGREEGRTAYPGHYVPSRRQEDVDREIDRNGDPHAKAPPWDKEETDSCVTIRMALPGLHREDILLRTSGRDLVISWLHGPGSATHSGEPVGHGLGPASIRTSIPLPEGVDTQLISAAYDNGMLVILLPRSHDLSEPSDTSIPVC